MPPRRTILNSSIPATFPERDALLAAVRDSNTHDDLPALVYADWQEEHNQPEHAELIRVMCELRKTPEEDQEQKERRKQLITRVRELFKTPALKPLRKLLPNRESDALRRCHRGFVFGLTFFLSDQKNRSKPRLTDILASELSDLPNIVPFDKLNWLGVCLHHDVTTEHVAALAAVPWLSRLTWLETGEESPHIAPGMLAPIISSKKLGGLLGFETTGTIAASEFAGLYLAKWATGLREFPMWVALSRTTPDTSAEPDQEVALAAIEKIVSSPRAKQFVTTGENGFAVDEALAKILLASKYLNDSCLFYSDYDFARDITPSTQSLFIKRFRPRQR